MNIVKFTNSEGTVVIVSPDSESAYIKPVTVEHAVIIPPKEAVALILSARGLSGYWQRTEEVIVARTQ